MEVCLSSEFSVMHANEYRLYDILPRVADRQPEPRCEQLHVQMGILGILQYVVGLSAAVRHVSRVCGYEKCIFGSEWGCAEELGGEKEGQVEVGEDSWMLWKCLNRGGEAVRYELYPVLALLDLLANFQRIAGKVWSALAVHNLRSC